MEEEKTWLIFSVNTTKYALSSSYVKEIARDKKIYPLPFVPTFISGLINRQGEPYAVIDPAVILNATPQKTSLFLILENQNCLRITDVYKFESQKKYKLTKIAQKNKINFFIGSIKINQEKIFILDINFFIEKAKNDFDKN